jgi:hypothetical protein
MKPLRRSIFVAAFFAMPLGALFAQTKVSVIMPLGTGQYVSYNQYDTAYSGAKAVLSHSSFTVISSGETFQGMSNVSVILDSLGVGDPTGVHTLHYAFTSAGDLQAFADTAFLASQIPSALIANDTNIPNAWVDAYKMSLGTNVIYPILTTNSTVNGGIPVTITITGEYVGTESVQTPGGNYTTAYRFKLIGNLEIAGGVFSLIDTETDWIAPGVGIVKTQIPIDSISAAGTPISAGGREREMIAFGDGSSSVSQRVTPSFSSIQFFPNPASDNLTLSVDRAANHVFLYDATGRMVRSFEIATRTGDALLWVKDLPNGAYLARVQCVDGSVQQAHFMIQH